MDKYVCSSSKAIQLLKDAATKIANEAELAKSSETTAELEENLNPNESEIEMVYLMACLGAQGLHVLCFLKVSL